MGRDGREATGVGNCAAKESIDTSHGPTPASLRYAVPPHFGGGRSALTYCIRVATQARTAASSDGLPV
ncbi:hypothetical protein KOAAANKH_03327 [Brevundimonas sp. NIBR10]|nr:hypothetical protein KOAAANKH_03327 [Brevundimonas sp. NIBR10]